MSKYDSLGRWLQRQPKATNRVTASMAQLHRLVPLPASALLYAAWWANEDPDATRHVQARSWGHAGWEAFPDMVSRVVAFRRK